MLFFFVPGSLKNQTYWKKHTEGRAVFLCRVFICLVTCTHTYTPGCMQTPQQARTCTDSYILDTFRGKCTNTLNSCTYKYAHEQLPIPFTKYKKNSKYSEVVWRPLWDKQLSCSCARLPGREGEREGGREGDVKKKYCLWSDDICCSG